MKGTDPMVLSTAATLFLLIAQHLPPSPSPGATAFPTAGPADESVGYLAMAVAVVVGVGLLLLLHRWRRNRRTHGAGNQSTRR